MNPFSACSEYLRETQGVNPEWEAYRLSVMEKEAPKGYIKVWGAVAPRKKRNPKQRDWRKKDKATASVHFVSNDALNVWAEKKHESLGTCPVCNGTGLRIVGWDHVTGSITEPCKRCNSTGRYVPVDARK